MIRQVLRSCVLSVFEALTQVGMTFLKVGIETKRPLLELHISKHLIDWNEHLTKLCRNPVEAKDVSLKLRVELTVLHHSTVEPPDVVCIA